MTGQNVRRMVLDLTPIVDVVMILLFGVMINSVIRTEIGVDVANQEVAKAMGDSDARRQETAVVEQKAKYLADVNQQLRERLEETTANLQRSDAELQELARKLQQEKANISISMARLLQMSEEESKAFTKEIDKVSAAGAGRLSQVAAELRQEQEPLKVYRAIRRIEEMQKVFTFVDLHLDKQDYLSVISNAHTLDRFPVRGRTADDIEVDIRRALEAVNFNQMVLFLYSYEGAARDLTRERAEAAVNALLAHYRNGATGQGRQFRYGRVGLVELPPVSVKETNP